MQRRTTTWAETTHTPSGLKNTLCGTMSFPFPLGGNRVSTLTVTAPPGGHLLLILTRCRRDHVPFPVHLPVSAGVTLDSSSVRGGRQGVPLSSGRFLEDSALHSCTNSRATWNSSVCVATRLESGLPGRTSCSLSQRNVVLILCSLSQRNVIFIMVKADTQHAVS